MIEIKNLSKTYKSKKSIDTNAINNISLKLNDKGLVFIVGKSGSGKSTLLNLIGGLDSVDKGSIIVDNIVCNDSLFVVYKTEWNTNKEKAIIDTLYIGSFLEGYKK